MKTKIRSLLLLGVIALLLTACRIVVDTDIKPDGSGELRTSVVFTAQEREDFTQKPENESKSICDGAREGAPAGATFVEEMHGDETFCVTERSFNNLTELRNFYAGMGQVTVNTLQFELGKFMLDVDVDLTDNEDGGGLENEWQLTLPGQIGSQNADRVEGQTLVWVISPGEKGNLHAESTVGVTPATLGPTTGALILVVVAVFVLGFGGGLVAFLMLRRTRNTNSFSGVL